MAETDETTFTQQVNGSASPSHLHVPEARDLHSEECQEVVSQESIDRDSEHEDHEYTAMAEEQKAVLSSKLVQTQKQAAITLEKIDLAKEDIKSESTILSGEICAHFDALAAVLEEQKKVLLEETLRLTHQKLACLKAQEASMLATQSKLESIAKEFKEVSSHEDNFVFLINAFELRRAMEHETCDASAEPVEQPDLVARILLPAHLRQACVTTNYICRGVPDLDESKVRGSGLKDAETGCSATFDIQLVNRHFIGCRGDIDVKLTTVRDGTITRPDITPLSPSHYTVSYAPIKRGRHVLSVKVNGYHIRDSPFTVFVRTPLSQMTDPVSSITDVDGPAGIHLAGEKLLVCEFEADQVVIYNHNHKMVETIQGQARRVRKLKGPTEVTTDSQSNMYVATTGDNCLHKFSKEGVHIKTVSGTGKKGDHFRYPSGMHTFEDRLLFVCDSENSRVLVFDTDLKYQSTIPRHFFWPSTIVTDNSGRIYICDHEKGRVQVLSQYKQHLFDIAHTLQQPITAHIFRELLYVTDQMENCVTVFTLSGNLVGSFGQNHLCAPEGLAIDEDGFIYVTNDRQNILIF